MIHENLSGETIGAAMAVLNELKPGLDEKIYERALIIELKHRGHIVSAQDQSRLVFHGHTCCADDRLSKHHALGSGSSHQFQEHTPGMETRVAFAATRGSKHC